MYMGIKPAFPVDKSVDELLELFPQGELILKVGRDPICGLRREYPSHM